MGDGGLRRWLKIALLLLLLVNLYRLLVAGGALELLSDGERLRGEVSELGAWGPVAVILAIALAIVFNPLPSAPIALAAGALYGHAWGTLYVVTGAELGALVAFALARALGRDAISHLLGERLSLGGLGSQNGLTAMVFISRLLPFLSFDLISYAAGLTPLRVWRFALATLAGILPASFLLAHFGSEMVAERLDGALFTLLILGALTLIPLLIALARRHCARLTTPFEQ